MVDQTLTRRIERGAYIALAGLSLLGGYAGYEQHQIAEELGERPGVEELRNVKRALPSNHTHNLDLNVESLLEERQYHAQQAQKYETLAQRVDSITEENPLALDNLKNAQRKEKDNGIIWFASFWSLIFGGALYWGVRAKDNLRGDRK